MCLYGSDQVDPQLILGKMLYRGHISPHSRMVRCLMDLVAQITTLRQRPAQDQGRPNPSITTEHLLNGSLSLRISPTVRLPI